jgi:deoxyribonuclease V
MAGDATLPSDPDLRRWDVSPTEARELQARLRRLVSLEAGVRVDDVRVVAGVDCSYVRDAGTTVAYAGAVAVAFPSLDMLEDVVVEQPVSFPYVPGLLSFREVPAMSRAVQALGVAPEVVICDAQGYAHPRRIGAASHLGLVLDLPTVGCAKSRLVGGYEEPLREFGARSPLVDRGEVVGTVVRTRPTVAPLFVSPGHRVSVELAVDLVLRCCRAGERLPVPTARAHDLVTERTRPLRKRSA